jgi:methylamine dehydrogenase accessory protein MauD
MNWLVISNVLLWVGFIGMVLVNIALARQIGVLYERVAPAGALALNQVLEVGRTAPLVPVESLAGDRLDIGRASELQRSTLLFFLSPDCVVCKSLLPVVKSAARAESSWLDVIFASDGADQDHGRVVEEFSLEQPYVVSEILGRTYGVSKLPYGVVIDEMGKVASMGILNSREHVESLFEAKERKVASIQEYMAAAGSSNRS